MENIISALKNAAIVIGTLSLLYTTAWSLGFAPITNSIAENMIRDAVNSQSMIIQNQIKILETKLEKKNNDLKTSVKTGQSSLRIYINRKTKLLQDSADASISDINDLKIISGRVDERTKFSKEQNSTILQELRALRHGINR